MHGMSFLIGKYVRQIILKVFTWMEKRYVHFDLKWNRQVLDCDESSLYVAMIYYQII